MQMEWGTHSGNPHALSRRSPDRRHHGQPQDSRPGPGDGHCGLLMWTGARWVQQQGEAGVTLDGKGFRCGKRRGSVEGGCDGHRTPGTSR